MPIAFTRKLFLSRALAACLAVAPLASFAQAAYPVRPIKLIVPFPAGGPTDTLARTVAQALAEPLGQQMIIDNRAGGNGIIALDAANRAESDGYTLIMLATSIAAINPSLLKDTMKVDPATDLTPVAFVASIPNALVVNPNVPAHSVKELVEYMKKDSKSNFAGNGAGTTTTVGWILFERAAGFASQHIIYKGDAPMMTDLVSNVVQASMPTVFGAAPFVRDGRLRALAVTGAERSPALPDVPTVAESGFPGYEATTWFGIAAPKGTPEAVLQKLNAAINQAIARPAVQQKLRDLGATSKSMSTQEFRTFMAAERKKWGDIVTSSGIKAE
jgi:tripartite-type tricarboxylate transporter receptor subunit TctC